MKHANTSYISKPNTVGLTHIVHFPSFAMSLCEHGVVNITSGSNLISGKLQSSVPVFNPDTRNLKSNEFCHLNLSKYCTGKPSCRHKFSGVMFDVGIALLRDDVTRTPRWGLVAKCFVWSRKFWLCVNYFCSLAISYICSIMFIFCNDRLFNSTIH